MAFVKEVALPYTGSDCLIWPFGRGSTGYGHLLVDGRLRVAPRYVCRLAHGDPPNETYEATHSCNAGHTGCVNPNHLLWKTREGNVEDKRIAGTLAVGLHMPQSHLTEADIRSIRKAHPRISMKKLSVAHGVCETTISNIIHRRKWAWVTDEP